MQQNVVFLDYTHVIATPYLDFPIPPLFPFNLPHWPYLGGAGDVSHEQLILGRVANASPDEIRKRVRERVVAEAAAKAEAERIAAEAS